MSLSSTKDKPFSPFQNEIVRLSDILSDMVIVMSTGIYQAMYIKDVVSGKDVVISFPEIMKDREAVRELLSVATDMLFDGDLK